MDPGEQFLGVAAYLASSLSLALASWAWAEITLPRRARLGLRLAAVIAGQMVLCGILVQTLGVLGLFRAPWYLACSLAPGIAILWLRRQRRPLATFSRLLQQAFRLWIAAPAWGLGWLGALFPLYLAKRYFFLPRDIDALTLHGPMIAEWIQSGRVALGSAWNYPQFWEYQLAPSYLLLRSDVLVVLPSLLAVVALALVVRELAARLALGGKAAHLLALLVATMPIVWREPLKNDPIFAFALLLGILAADRAARRLGGSFWLMQLAVFLVLGTKATGFLYALALDGTYLFFCWRQRRRADGAARPRVLAGLVFTLLFQASAVAVQVRNFLVNGNPFYPLRLEIFGYVVFAGPGDPSGTTVLDNLRHLEIWRDFLLVGSRVVGAELPILALLLAASLVSGLAAARRLLAAREMPRPRAGLGLILPVVALLLWGLFVATPWSSGLGFGNWHYIGSGASLRYAIAPLALTYLAATVMAQRFLGRRAIATPLALAFPVLVWGKWTNLASFGDTHILLWKLFALWILALGAAWGLCRLAARAGGRTRMAAAALLALLLTAAFARWAEGIRDAVWAPPYRAIWTHVYDRVPAGSTIGTNHPVASFRYFLYGRRFENRLLVVDIGQGDGGQIPADVVYFYVFVPKGEGLKRRIAAMGRRGWQLLAISDDRESALLGRSP